MAAYIQSTSSAGHIVGMVHRHMRYSAAKKRYIVFVRGSNRAPGTVDVAGQLALQ